MLAAEVLVWCFWVGPWEQRHRCMKWVSGQMGTDIRAER